MAKFRIDKKALKRFQDRRPVYAAKTLELLKFKDEDDAPLYCIPVLNDIEIPLSIASFADEQDFLPPVNFLIHVDEHDGVIPAGRHAKLLSSYLMDNSHFEDLRTLWHGLIGVRFANFKNPTGTRFTKTDYQTAIRHGVEFFIVCLAFHEIEHDNDMTSIRPILASAGIEESDLDLEP